MKKLLSPFKILPKGFYRLIIVGSILLPLIISIVIESNNRNSHGTEFLFFLVFGFLIYWILARVGIWIYQGFKEEEKN